MVVDSVGLRGWELGLSGFRAYLDPAEPYLFMDLNKEIIISSPKKVGSSGSRYRI